MCGVALRRADGLIKKPFSRTGSLISSSKQHPWSTRGTPPPSSKYLLQTRSIAIGRSEIVSAHCCPGTVKDEETLKVRGCGCVLPSTSCISAYAGLPPNQLLIWLSFAHCVLQIPPHPPDPLPPSLCFLSSCGFSFCKSVNESIALFFFPNYTKKFKLIMRKQYLTSSHSGGCYYLLGSHLLIFLINVSQATFTCCENSEKLAADLFFCFF